MNLPETEKELLAFLDSATRSIDESELDSFTTSKIAAALSISRNLSSQYLNDLVREGLVVKAGAHPVHYFHRAALERYLQTSLGSSTYPTVFELFNNQDQKKGFERAIGYSQSLGFCVEQCMAAMSYPPYGLPMLLVGEPGTGKTLLAHLTYEFGVSAGILKESAELKVIDCARYKDDPAELARAWFGNDEAAGIRDRLSGSVCLFKSAELVPQAVMDDALDANGSKGRSRDGITPPRVIFISSETSDGTFVQSMLRRIPMVISLPPFHERTLREREELALGFLRAEGRRMGVDVSIGRSAFSRLVNMQYRENIRELKTYVTNCCAEAYLHREGDRITVQTCHLAPGLLAGSAEQQDVDDLVAIDVAQGITGSDLHGIIHLFEAMVELHTRFVAGKLDEKGFGAGVAAYARDFEDYVVFGGKAANAKLDAWIRMISSAIEDVNATHGIDLTKKCAVLIARGLQIQLWSEVQLAAWESSHRAELLRLYASLVQNHLFARTVVAQIRSEVKNLLGVEMNVSVCIPLFFEIAACEPGSRHRRRAGVILCHGYSTASSMADSANRILGTRVFESIDMPYDQQLKDVVPRLRAVIERLSYCREIVVLVDSGSLETVHEDFAGIANLSLGVINNASTGLAIEIGSGLLQGKDIAEVLMAAQEACSSRYRVISGRELEDALMFCSENGIIAAEKVKMLLAQSFERDIPVQLISSDYNQLARNGLNDEALSRYNVRAVVGTLNPKIPGIPFVALEDIIAKERTALDSILAEHMHPAELTAFHRNLVKSFTLENVIESITILNPQTLFDEVSAAVKRLGSALGTTIDGRFGIGLYVHLCCLVERLVTRSPIESYAGSEVFEREHADFINAFRTSFKAITRHYKVEIPTAEIAYAWDYIHAAESNGNQSDSTNSAGDSDEF